MINVMINQLPLIGDTIVVYMTIINSDDSLDQLAITSLQTLYGNINLQQPNQYIPNDNLPCAILVNGNDISGNIYIGILYTNALNQPQIPDNFVRIIQKIPLGIFNDTSTNSIVGQDMKARALMANDYYQQYFNIAEQVYSFAYSPELEFEYNGTVGLLSDSAYPLNLFLWFSSLNIVALNTYDLELAISQYIFFRIGVSCPVYCDDGVILTTGYWNLGIPGYTELGFTTILASNSAPPSVNNLAWIIYNSNSFTPEFETEITNLIIRLSRADIGNLVTYSSIVDPTSDGFNLIGFTYKNDPRTIYGKCIQYLGITEYPLNIVAYKKT